jgi:hypothetical protein
MINATRIHPVRTAIGLGAALACAFALMPGTGDAASRTKTLRFYSKPVALTVTTASGKVISKPPYPDMKPGDVLDVYAVDFKGDHLHHAAKWSMSEHLHCVFGKGQPDCVSHVADGGSLMIFAGSPGTLVAGTGRYEGATGRVLKNEEVEDNASDVVVRITLRS